MSFVGLVNEKLRAGGNTVKLLVSHTITNQRHIATDLRTYTDSSNQRQNSLKLTLTFVKSQSAIRLWKNPPHKFKCLNSRLLYVR